MTQAKTFVFIFLEGREEPTEEDSPDTWMLKYARARHADVPVHIVLSVEEAIDIMLKELMTGGTLGEVYVYTHSSSSYLLGRLKAEDSYGGISKKEAKEFLESSEKVKDLLKYAGPSTNIYFRGCNLGKDEEALKIWRDIFGGKYGSGSAFDMFVHWGIEMYDVVATIDKKNVPNTKTQIKHTEDIASFVEKVKKKFKRIKNDFWRRYEDEVNKALNKWLTDRYNLLKKGGELPSNMIDIPDDKLVEKMRENFNKYGGVPFICLVPELLEAGISSWKVRELLKKKGAIFPEDTSWSQHIKKVIFPIN
jgi:hypothetical protein